MEYLKIITTLAVLAPSFVLAQGAPADEDEVIELSPFIVDASQDSGYLASQTMAGTRLATDLKDAPSPVTVLTTDFLNDIDATDLNTALAFVPAVDDDPRAYNSLNNNPVSSRVRGFEQTNTNVNFFPSRTTTDRYNIDRIEINRGPNAILFGIGNPGGTFVATTKNANLFKTFGSVQSRFDTLDSWRFVGDWNQVVVKGRLAVRVAGMTEDQKGFIDPMSDRDKRFYVALNASVVEMENYDLRVRYQYENVSQVTTTRSFSLPWDNITAWQQAGSPTYDFPDQVPFALRWPAGMQAMPNNGTITNVVSGSKADVPTFIFDNRPSSAKSFSTTGQRFRIGAPQSEALIPGTNTPIPTDISYPGRAQGFTLDSDSHSVFVEQTFFDKLFTEFAWYQQGTDRIWNRSSGGSELFVDVLNFLPNGAPNPNAGQVFTQGSVRFQDQYREIEVFRFTAGYEIDLRDTADWLGRHRFGVLLENSRDLLGLNDFVDVNLLTDRGPFINNLPNFGNRIQRRSYLFSGQRNYWSALGNPGIGAYTPLSGTVDPSSVKPESGDPFETSLANFRVSRQETETDSWVFSMQSFFPAPGFGAVNERLIAFWGIRGDDLESTQLDSDAMNAAKVKGILPDWRTLPYNEVLTFEDETLTWGVIYRPTPWLDIFYNQSEVLSPGSSIQDVFGDPISPSTGEGWDSGLRFSLLKGKLEGSLSFFESSQLNIPVFNVIGGNINAATPGPINNLMDALIAWQQSGTQPAGFPDLDYESVKIDVANPIDTRDSDARGIDWDITYNPTPNWRISIRGQKLINEASNVISRSFRHYQEILLPVEAAFTAAGLQDVAIPDFDRTIAEFFADTAQEVAKDKFSIEGVRGARSSEWRHTLVTNYTFPRNTMLKGWSIGGNLRYVSPRKVQALIDPANGFTGQYVSDDAVYKLGLNVGYRRRLSKGVTMILRLNVSNVLDDDDPSIQEANPTTGEVFAYRPVEGREGSVTATFRF